MFLVSAVVLTFAQANSFLALDIYGGVSTYPGALGGMRIHTTLDDGVQVISNTWHNASSGINIPVSATRPSYRLTLGGATDHDAIGTGFFEHGFGFFRG